MNFRSVVLFISLIYLLSLDADSLYGQSADTALLHVHKTSDFEISGDGRAANWQNEKWLTLPKRELRGVEYQTKLKLLYSDSGIYCLYYCEDNKLTATLTKDFSDLYNEDVVEAFFWTDEAIPEYFEYELSPLNYELPILVPNNKGNFFGWRPWHYEGNRRTRNATHITKNNNKIVSWTAEFFIPFTLLKPMLNVPAKRGSRWRANFYRIDYDQNVSSWSWRHTGASFHEYEKFGTLSFD